MAETAVTAGCIIDIGCDMVHAVRPMGPPDDAVLHGSVGYDAGEMTWRCYAATKLVGAALDDRNGRNGQLK